MKDFTRPLQVVATWVRAYLEALEMDRDEPILLRSLRWI
jgi:hypothetical protein